MQGGSQGSGLRGLVSFPDGSALNDPKRDRARKVLEAEKARRSAHYFIFESGYLKTKDEHDKSEPVKAVPDIPYLRALLDCYLVSGKITDPQNAKYALAAGIPLPVLIQIHEVGILFVEKSRDMFVTNLTCAYLHWRGRALDHQLILLQSKKEDDAAKLVYTKEPQFARISFMESQLPKHLQMMEFPKAGAYGHLYCPNGSHWRAIAEGGHIIRSEHPSVIFSDEAAFQDEFSASYTAAMPATEGGGQYLAISSAAPGQFEELVEPDAQTHPTEIPGVEWRLASGSIPVLRVHYSADPDKRPGTVLGERWREGALQRYPGGLRSPRWRQEMEIEYRAFGGLKVFPDWELWAQGPFVVKPFLPHGYKLYGSYDHGWVNPAAFHVHGIGPDGHKVTLWECYADRLPVQTIAKIIKGENAISPGRPDAKIQQGRTKWEGNPFAGQLQWIVADPSIWAEDQQMHDGPNKSIAWIFRQYGVHFIQGEKGSDGMVAEWLLGDLWADPNNPRYRIVDVCKWLIWELGQQRYKSLSPHLALNANDSEVFVDKNNHAWDGLKMFFKKFPPGPTTKKPLQTPATFAWWQKVAKAAQKGGPLPTYRRELVG